MTSARTALDGRVADRVPPAPARTVPPAAWILAALAGVAGVAAMCWSGLNHDVRYVLGGLRAAGRGGVSVSGTFVHRPAYRWVLSGLDHLSAGPVAVREAWIRLLAAAASAAFLRPRAPVRYATAVAALLALAIPVWPTTPYSYDTRHATYTALERARTRQDLGRWLDGVRARIGSATPVTYLAFGDVGYLLGNPTHCRYPTPDFLQRTRYDRGITDQASYRENLGCLDDSTSRYAVLDTSWFPLKQVAPAVAATVRARFDCAAPLAAYPRMNLVICPRR